jgi:hypothetical protein
MNSVANIWIRDINSESFARSLGKPDLASDNKETVALSYYLGWYKWLTLQIRNPFFDYSDYEKEYINSHRCDLL